MTTTEIVVVVLLWAMVVGVCAAGITVMVKDYKWRKKLKAERDREEQKPAISSIGIYDECETIEDCTVEILHNSVTDEYSIGWYRNNPE
jgi:Na+-transporting NADH:ubiquinone oxidoreductase subunit NqrC